ncbi:MAG TPA: DNA polymerase I, partial [Limnochordia bacterium]|nr:DNA polymerase I [Limnochordia bacterium]
MSARAKTFMLIDGHSLLYRAFFALPESLTRADGSPTNAVYGLALMLRRLLADERPAACVIAFDGPGRTFRAEVYDEYKANRSAMPDALVSQIDAARQLAQCLGLKVIVSAGCEADDVIGTMSRKAQSAGFHSLIVTGDRDALQLV